MSKRSIKLLLEDILESGKNVLSYTNGYNSEAFIEDSKTKDAVIRNFEIIGEASNRLNQEFRDSYPILNWDKLRGFRNRIVHEYFGIVYLIVWTIIEDDIRPLMISIQELIDNEF